MYRCAGLILTLVLLVCSIRTLAVSEAVDDIKVQTVDSVQSEARPFEVPMLTGGPRPSSNTGIYSAMPMPEQDNRGTSKGRGELVSFDLRTRTEQRTPASVAVKAGMHRTESGEGSAVRTGPAAPDSDKDFSGLWLVSDPNFGIYPRHVRLEITFENSQGMEVSTSGSGTLIDPMHVLTAGHCLYLLEDSSGGAINSFVTTIEVMPGYNDGAGPMGSAFGVHLHTWSGWTQNGDRDADVGVIDLDRPIGALAGWRGVGTTSDFGYYQAGAWAHYTYPRADVNNVDVYTGEFMYANYGTFDVEDDPLVGFQREMYKSSSGGGAIRDNVAWAVATHVSETDGNQESWDTRVSDYMFDDIVAMMAADRPSSVDLVAMDVELATNSEIAGNQINGLNFVAHNYSTASFNSTVYYSVVLSLDSTISAADHYITSGSASVNLGSMESARINVPAATTYVPSVSAGDYTLGVIISNSDANAGNNATQGDDTERFTVQCMTQGVPAPVFPVDDHPCVPTDLVLDWGSVPGVGVIYQLQVGRTLWNNPPTYSTTLTQHLVEGMLEGTLYSWRVRAIAACGSIGPWSDPFSFRTEGQLGQVSRFEPAPDRSCLDTTVDFSWDAVPEAIHYRLKIVEDGGSLFIVDEPGTSVQYSGLTPGTSYTWSIKAKDACGYWGSYSTKTTFHTAPTIAIVPEMLSPLPGACEGEDIFLQAVPDPVTTEHEFEVQTAAGAPVQATVVNDDALWVLSMEAGDYRWRTRAKSCLVSGEVWGAWSAWSTFSVDLTAPAFVTPPGSSSHTVGVWSPYPVVNFEWEAATDNCTVAAYWVTGDQSAHTVPDGSTVDPPSPGNREFEFSEGNSNWFHIVAVDAAGNLSDVQHLGPFYIDLGPPADPLLMAEVPSGSWLNATDLTVSWEAVTDAGAGMGGYSTAWSTSSSYVLDDTIDTTDLSSTLVTAPEGHNYFYAKSVDNIGNAGTQQQYHFIVDRSDPVMNIWNPQSGNTYLNGDITQVDFVANDMSGPSQLEYYHSYSTDGGTTWYSALICDSWAGANCVSGGGGGGCTAPVGGGGPWDSYWLLPYVYPGDLVLYRIVATDQAGNQGEAFSNGTFEIMGSSGVGNGTPVVQFELNANTPNPFNPRTTINYAVPHDAQVRLTIYDVTGRLVRTLVNDYQAGPVRYETVWDGTNDLGMAVASGMYIYRIEAGDFVQAKRMTLLK